MYDNQRNKVYPCNGNDNVGIKNSINEW
jgi:hypothetical protein